MTEKERATPQGGSSNTLAISLADVPERLGEYQYGPTPRERETEGRREAILRSIKTSNAWQSIGPRGRESCEALMGYANGAGEVRITMEEFRSNFAAAGRGTPKADSQECWRTARKRIAELEAAGVVTVAKQKVQKSAYKFILVVRFAARYVGRALSWLRKVTQVRKSASVVVKESSQRGSQSLLVDEWLVKNGYSGGGSLPDRLRGADEHTPDGLGKLRLLGLPCSPVWWARFLPSFLGLAHCTNPTLTMEVHRAMQGAYL